MFWWMSCPLIEVLSTVNLQPQQGEKTSFGLYALPAVRWLETMGRNEES